VRSSATAAVAILVLAAASGASARGIRVVERAPHELTARIPEAQPNQLFRVTYDDGQHRFVWENLTPDSTGAVRLRDDKHLRPEHRLRCESRTHVADPVVFDDLQKGVVAGKRRHSFGVPVSTFGGPGYLVPGLSDLKRDDFGNLWLYLDHPPYAILKYSADLTYGFALLLPDACLAHDLDAAGNLYILHRDNWVSKHGPLGEDGGAWELPRGREPGEFIAASGMAIDRDGGWLYLADEKLGRVQRFDLAFNHRPMPVTVWGWLGRADLAYTCPGEYDEKLTYYQLDRPRQLVLDGRGRLFVSCEHWISKFDLATGRQLSFGPNPVLGWGGTFSDSPFSSSAALDGHWQRHWLAGIDAAGNIYVADRENEFVINPRLQVFDPDGVVLGSFDIEDELTDASGERIYVAAVRSLVSGARFLYLVDAAGRIYRGPDGERLASGGRLFLGPGAAGRQLDLSRVKEVHFDVEPQASYVKHRSQGRVLAPRPGEYGTGNCEREGSSTLRDGERSLWVPARIGEQFEVVLFDAEDRLIPSSDYRMEVEDKPGLFGTQYDFFRVTNRSGGTWRGVTFVAESLR
jgi:hypothetical protein